MGDDSSVRVALRVRPQIPREIIDMCRVCTSVTAGEPQVWLGNDKAFTFDFVFDMNSIQAQIYESCVYSLIEGCFDGFNATVLAYGQTGSGKTYTMGTGFDMNISDDEYGIIPRAVDHLFHGIEERQQEAKDSNQQPPEFKIICQFMELYNEEVIDLFDPARDGFARGKKSNIKIQEDPSGGICTIGLTHKIVTSKLETMQCLKIGALSRTTASTQMNVQSSRSHAVFTLHIKQQRLIPCSNVDSESNDMSDFETLTAKFHFVDLAGSERLKRTGATGERAKEGISINCGLLALGNVISALGDKSKRGNHVPYRDSKLTRLLQDSLGGNSRTIMIACVSPSDRDFMETLNTLKYANRARNIKNKITINQDKTSKTIAALRMEIQQLQLELMDYKQGKKLIIDGVETVNDTVHENTMLQTEMNNLRTRIKAMQETIEQQKSKIVQLLTEKAAGSWIGSEPADVPQLVQGYMKEIEDLRTKMLESENTCQILRRSVSRTQSKSAIPRAPSVCSFEAAADIDETESVDVLLEEAKMNIIRLRRKEKRLKQKPTDSLSEIDNANEEQDEEAKSDDEDGSLEDADEMLDLSSDSDSDDKETLKFEEDLADLTCEISLKQKLIEELERSQRRMYTLRHQYEEKLLQLQNKIRVTQEERDKILSSFGSRDNQTEEKVKKIKQEYERKQDHLQKEIKKLQQAKKQHSQLMRNNSQYEQQMKTMRSDLADLKRAKVRLLNRMKDEATKHKEVEARRNKEIAQLKKESRMNQNQIRTLKAETKMKETVLRRRQEEVAALRKLAKPMSDKVAGRSVRSRTNLTSFDKKKTFSPRLAKQKWATVEKEINKVVLNRQAVTNLEKNMERYLEDRNLLCHKLEKTIKKRDKAILQGKDQMIKYLEDEIESVKANMDYIQENIHDCQTSIMEMVETKDGGNDLLDVANILSGLGFEDIKYFSERLLQFTLSQSTIALQKDTSLKEMESRMQQTVQNGIVYQQLLEHVMANQQPETDSVWSINDEPDPFKSSESSRSESPVDNTNHSDMLVASVLNADASLRKSMRQKVRRKTSTPEELLFAGSTGEGYVPLVPITDVENEEENSKVMSSSGQDKKEQMSSVSNGLPRNSSAPEFLKGVILPHNGRIKSSPLVCTHVAEGHNKAVLSVDATDELLFTSSTDRTVKIWDLSRAAEIQSLENHTTSVTTVKYNPASKLVFSVSSSLIKVWDIRENPTKCIKTLSSQGIAHPAASFSGSSRLPVGITVKDQQINDIALNQAGTILFAASGNIVRIWDMRKFTCTGKLTGGHQAAIMCLAMKEDKKEHCTLITGSKDHYIKLFEVMDGIGGLHTPKLNFDPPHYDGIESLTITDKYLFSGSRDMCIKKWDLTENELKQSLNQAHKDWICGLQVLSGGQILLSGCRGGFMKLWSVDTCAQIGEFKAHANPINALATNSTNVFSASSDGTVGIWKMKSLADSSDYSDAS